MTIPKIIHMFWLQGWDSAPELARVCAEAWQQLNPEYSVILHDEKALAQLTDALDFDVGILPVQAVSDILRAYLLTEHGGVWVDASVVPLAPLHDWLGAAEESGFFAFEGSKKDRVIDSWMLAARQRHPIMRGWWEEVRRYWTPRAKPWWTPPLMSTGMVRRPIGDIRWMTKWGLLKMPADPVDLVRENGPSRWQHIFPYFWFHYLFDGMIRDQPDLARQWGAAFRLGSAPPHAMAWHLKAQPSASLSEFLDLADVSPVQKLRFKRSLSAERQVAIAQALVGRKFAP